MLNVEKWLQEEKLFGMSGAGILLSVFLICVVVFIRMKYHESRKYDVVLEQKRYVIAGMAQMEDGGKKIFVPVYREAQ